MNRSLCIVSLAGIALFLVALPASWADELTAEDYIKFHEPLSGVMEGDRGGRRQGPCGHDSMATGREPEVLFWSTWRPRACILASRHGV